jgi:hypothetical protein
VYLREGFTITGQQTIENFAEWTEQQTAKSAPKAEATRGEHAEAPTEHKAKS